MFDATAGTARLAETAETASDDFAAWFGSLGSRQQAKVAVALASNAADAGPDEFIARLSGTATGLVLATPTPGASVLDHVNAITADSSVDPGIRALLKRVLIPNDPNPIRVGPDGTPTAQQTVSDHVNAIMADSSVDPGIRALFKRVLIPNDPNPIRVGPDGTPVAITTAETERDRHRDRANTAEEALRDERDATKSGSLAHQLAAAQAAAATPAGMVAKATVLAQVDKAVQAWNSGRKARTSDSWVVPEGSVQPLSDALNEAQRLAS